MPRLLVVTLAAGAAWSCWATLAIRDRAPGPVGEREAFVTDITLRFGKFKPITVG
jgi:hypothetical protein